MFRSHLMAAGLVFALILSIGQSPARARVVRTLPGGGSMISLPHNVTDSQGNQWMIYPSGYVQVQGNQPLYGQAGTLQINGAGTSVRNNQARLDPKTGEVIFENMSANGFTVTRRILIDKENALARYVDIIKNNKGQDQTVQVQIQSNMNFGIDNPTTIDDPRHKGNSIGWSAGNNNGKAIFEMMAGKGSKLTPNFNFQQGNTWVQSQYAIPIPANKEVALVHLHGITGSVEQASQFIEQYKETKLLSSLPADLRKEVVNFVTGQGFIGDRELLRGDLFDVVEIRGGDQMRGTIKAPQYKLHTFYGDVDLPAGRVVGLINVGEYRPRQLLITTDGEIFGGRLEQQRVDLQLTSGQVTQIPLGQISRFGYRKRPGEPEEWTFNKPFVSLRSGDRIDIEMPTQPIDVVTRYGPLKLDPKTIAAIIFQNEDSGVHDIRLTDGSHFAGLVSGAEFEMKLSGENSAATEPSAEPSTSPAPSIPQQVVHFPTSAIAKIQLAAAPDDVDEDQTPTLKLSNDDLLVGALSGELKLDTAFDTLSLNAAQLRKLNHDKDNSTDVQVTLWDGSVMSGQLQDPSLKCQLASGVTVSVPVALVDEYNQPQPAPDAGMIEKIKASVAQLNADDWKTRDRAQAELTTMGSVVISTLKEMRPSQPPEAQQRIDQILSSVQKKK
jgi:hypothetical protein